MFVGTLAMLLLAAISTSAYLVMPARGFSTRLFGIGDILKNALANDPSITGPPPNPGLSKEPEQVTVEFLPSKKVAKAYLGQKVSDIARANGVAIKYSCKKGTAISISASEVTWDSGECNTCQINFNGKLVKACQSSLPAVSKETKFTVDKCLSVDHPP